MPNGMGQNGLPTSMQIIGAPLRDREVIGLGEAVQGATKWHRERPAAFV
jgi:aspartyl-tRNA(Asn)/glutamyl-tRNA(Gln) amidotransferase subunit A